MAETEAMDRVRSVQGTINYAIDSGGINRFHAKDSSLDTFRYDTHTVPIIDGRELIDQPRLDREGFALLKMASAVADFRNLEDVKAIHFAEIASFISGVTQADEVVIAGPPALRFG